MQQVAIEGRISAHGHNINVTTRKSLPDRYGEVAKTVYEVRCDCGNGFNEPNEDVMNRAIESHLYYARERRPTNIIQWFTWKTTRLPF